jgi:hypothetical protein
MPSILQGLSNCHISNTEHPFTLKHCTFTCVAVQSVWLLGLAGVELPTPKEMDDPQATCAAILGGCKKLGFAPPAYHPSKLTARVCAVLWYNALIACLLTCLLIGWLAGWLAGWLLQPSCECVSGG